MTVIKFEDKQNSGVVIKPGVNNALTRVFDAAVKYCLKENLPESAGRNELIFTTDTHEFFRGNGKGLDLIPFNTVLMYGSFGDFPETGVETKIYVDKSTSLMFTWNGEAYVSLSGGGEGGIVIAPSDAKIGDLSKLATTDKTTVVAAINEVFNSLVKIDIDNVLTHIESMEIDIADIKSTLANGDASVIADLEAKVGDLETLTTAEKTSLVGAINELKTLIGSGGTDGGDGTDIAVIVGTLAELKTVDKSTVVAALNEIFTKAHNNSIQISNISPTVTAIEGNVTVLQSTVTDIDNSIAQINSVIGSLSSLTTEDKSTIVSAINELVIKVDNIDKENDGLAEFTVLVNELKSTVGDLTTLSTTAKTDLVAAINELVGNVTGINKEIDLIQGNIDEVETSIATNTKDISALTERTTNIETRMSSIEGVNDLVQSLLNDMVPQLQGRISTLEAQVGQLREIHGLNEDNTGGTGGDGGSGEPASPGEVLWQHEFVLPVGVAVYELGEDPEYVANGYSIDMMEDLFGDTQKVRLFSLGNAGYEPTEPVEVPFVGTEGTPPTEHGVWETYTGSDVVFQVASMIAWRFRLVKYA